MPREVKLGVIIAGAFVSLIGGVVTARLIQDGTAPEPVAVVRAQNAEPLPEPAPVIPAAPAPSKVPAPPEEPATEPAEVPPPVPVPEPVETPPFTGGGFAEPRPLGDMPSPFADEPLEIPPPAEPFPGDNFPPVPETTPRTGRLELVSPTPPPPGVPQGVPPAETEPEMTLDPELKPAAASEPEIPGVPDVPGVPSLDFPGVPDVPAPEPEVPTPAPEPEIPTPDAPGVPEPGPFPGLPVPPPAGEPIPVPEPAPEPIPVPEPAPEPIPVPEPAPEPAFEPAMPTPPEPEPSAEPEPMSLPVPEPAASAEPPPFPSEIASPAAPTPNNGFEIDGGTGATAMPHPSVNLAPPLGGQAPSPEVRPNGLETTGLQEPRVEAFDQDIHYVRRGETWESVSSRYYNDPAYARSLFNYNRAEPGGATLTEQMFVDQVVKLPPIWVLRKRYPSEVPGLPGVPDRRAAPAVSAMRAAPAEEVAYAPVSESREYIVAAPGESIQEIARKTLGSVQHWRQIWDLNPQVNPGRPLAPGTKLYLPSR